MSEHILQAGETYCFLTWDDGAAKASDELLFAHFRRHLPELPGGLEWANHTVERIDMGHLTDVITRFKVKVSE